MWARLFEVGFGLWLLASPAVVGHAGASALIDRVAGGLVILLAALSQRPATRHSHYLSLLVSAGLIGFAWAAFPRPSPPHAQNEILIGLLLGLFAIVPDRASSAPPAWRAHVRPPDGVGRPR